jgi:hypothetical protein
LIEANEAGANFGRLQPYLWAAGIYCLVAVAGLAAFAYVGRLPDHDLNQIAPFLAHLTLNGIAIVFFAWSRQSDSPVARSATLRVGDLLLLFSLGLVGLILAIQAAFELTVANAPALLLFVPATVPLLPFLPMFSPRSADYPGAEMLDELPRLPMGETARLYAGFTIRMTLFFAALFIAIEIAPVWHGILRNVLWSGARYGVVEVVYAAFLVISHTPQAAFMIAGVFLLLVFSGVTALIGQAREGRRAVSEEQREFVQSRLRSLWDYANSPGQPTLSTSVSLVAIIPFLLTYGFGFFLLVKSDVIAQWLAPASRFVTEAGWYMFVRNDRAAMFPLFLSSLVLGYSSYRLCIGVWPRALQGTLLYRLQRGRTFRLDDVNGLRRDLTKDVLRDDAHAFDPRRFLLARYRRVSYRLYLASLVLLSLSAILVWRMLFSYVLVTDAGFTSVSFFTGQRTFHRYSDVDHVHLECSPPKKDSGSSISYQVGFKDGESAELLSYDRLSSSADGVGRVDERLRSSGTRFVLFVDKVLGVRGAQACVDRLADEYGHAAVLARIMHLPD